MERADQDLHRVDNGIEQRPVRIQKSILDQQWNLIVAARQIETVLNIVTNKIEAR